MGKNFNESVRINANAGAMPPEAKLAYDKANAVFKGVPANAPDGVRAQAGDDELMRVVKDGMGNIHAAQTKQNERLDKIEADAALYQAGVDKLTVQAAGGIFAIPAKEAAEREAGKQPVHASTGLRGSQIGAHYRKVAQASMSSFGSPAANIEIADFIRGAAGLSCSQGVRAALSEGQDTAGGYAVPAVVMPSILDAMTTQSALLAAGASILPLTSAKSVSIAAVDELPQPAWRNENESVAIGGPTFRAVTATPRSIAIAVPISRELLADAVDMNRAVTQALAFAFAKAFDKAALVGSGVVPEPLGLYGMPGIAKVAQAGDKFAYADMLAAMQAQLDADAPAPTSIIMAPRTLVGLAGLVDSTGQPLNAPALLNGMVRRTSTGVPTNLGTGSDESLAFIGNFNTVQFVMRENFNVRLLQETSTSNGQLVFLAHARFDVVCQYPDAITVVTGVKS